MHDRASCVHELWIKKSIAWLGVRIWTGKENLARTEFLIWFDCRSFIWDMYKGLWNDVEQLSCGP